MNYLEPTATRLLLSPPEYKNPELEQKINENKNESSLYWGGEDLTDDDVAIIAYYLLQNNKVRNVLFGFSWLNRKG